MNFWNSMPEDIVSAPYVNIFNGRFDKYNTALTSITSLYERPVYVLRPTWIER